MTAGPSSALDASVLVLNKVFMAVHIISVRRAFCLLCKNLAEVVSYEDGQYATYDFETWRELSEYRRANFRETDDDWVRTASTEIQVPRVIRLLDYDKVPGLSHEVREKLCRMRPRSLGQAARISGVTPVAVSILLVHARSRTSTGRQGQCENI